MAPIKIRDSWVQLSSPERGCALTQETGQVVGTTLNRGLVDTGLHEISTARVVLCSDFVDEHEVALGADRKSPGGDDGTEWLQVKTSVESGS